MQSPEKMEVPFYEYIVVGCGGIGSAVVYWLSRRAGKNVLGLEQFQLGHENGGSQDHSRIIRLMYDELKYTKLTPHTFPAWAEAEKESGIQLVYKSGSLDFTHKGTAGEDLFRRYCKAMDDGDIPYDLMDAKELQKRFPQFSGPGVSGLVALLQKDGGLVDAASSNAVHIQLARGRGATVMDNTAVLKIDTMDDGTAMVHTSRGRFRCRRVVVTAGAWSNNVLGSLGVHIPLVVSQEQVTYYNTTNMKDFTKDKFPAWIYHGDPHDIYGMAIHGNTCSKIGIDCGGFPVTPDTRTFIPDPRREEQCKKFLEDVMPSYLGPINYTKTCLYTMTYDRSFVIDSLKSKGKPQVVFCIGAGHAYKFAALFGRILSELAIDGRTDLPIEPFTMDRPAITDPSFRPIYQNKLSTIPQAASKARL